MTINQCYINVNILSDISLIYSIAETNGKSGTFTIKKTKQNKTNQSATHTHIVWAPCAETALLRKQ